MKMSKQSNTGTKILLLLFDNSNRQQRFFLKLFLRMMQTHDITFTLELRILNIETVASVSTQMALPSGN